MEQGVVSSLKGQLCTKPSSPDRSIPPRGGVGAVARHPPGLLHTPARKLQREPDQQRRNTMCGWKGPRGGAGGLAQDNKARREGLGSACQSPPPLPERTPGPRASAKAHSPRRRPQPSPRAWESRLFCSQLPPLFSPSFIAVQSLSKLQGRGWQGSGKGVALPALTGRANPPALGNPFLAPRPPAPGPLFLLLSAAPDDLGFAAFNKN